ncbi:tRNA pseudouridine(13) synthase TruD [Cocleimonas flava]|uniref:tRNA pseudouridine synthase D n=2 Tax=Cocleimonas flava TaxID=634765 RepID=A0A4R1F059_9GAMM|nr:tRNA pseudouridine13 synthase [Cocleimonas flava]
MPFTICQLNKLLISYQLVIKNGRITLYSPPMTDLDKISFNKVNKNSTLSGLIRSTASDFQVDEIQQFSPSGIGEHVWLHIKKTGENTDWVGGLLAKAAGVPRRDVSYAGLKDRNAVTTQWFSVQMPGREAPDWQALLPESVEVLAEKRHDKKLKRGALIGNKFTLKLSDFKGEESELAATIERIKQQGVPNYFGAQRFGHNNYNIERAEKWFAGEFKFKDRAKRSIYLSSARSWIFNHILSARIEADNWNKAVEGDVYMLNGSKSCFYEALSDEIIQRVDKHDLHPTAALWGRGRLATHDETLGLETEIADTFKSLCDGLERNGLKQERRAMRISVENLTYAYLDKDGNSHNDSDEAGSTVELSFALPAGCYATSVLAEIGSFE